MKKLTGTTALSRRNKRKETPEAEQEKYEKITTVATRRNVTTGTSPVPMRLPENDKAELNLWLEELSEATGKKITGAKLLRGLIHMREKLNQKAIIKAINEAN
ncbi:hypothetical protein ACED51_10545 [Photobacterium swingsii]|uniref:Uncharacterized protein n=2 Tax=Vibrio TaxID=662 RepID=A0A0H3ZR92_9VIBR|nr:hypothetical protein [Vibrio tasmaniensis]AKN40815.1 hypothetical protein [Vibrio sp. 1F_189]